MKFIIASDIHGSLTFCQRLVDRYNEEKCDKLILLGDVLYRKVAHPACLQLEAGKGAVFFPIPNISLIDKGHSFVFTS